MHNNVTCGTTCFCGCNLDFGISIDVMFFGWELGRFWGHLVTMGAGWWCFLAEVVLFMTFFWLLWILSQFISLYYTVRNGESFHRGEYLWYVTYMFKVTYVMILIVCLFPGDLWLTLIFSTTISLSNVPFVE